MRQGEYHKVVLMNLGLVPAQAFCASQSEAAPYGSDKRKIDTEISFFIREEQFVSDLGFVP